MTFSSPEMLWGLLTILIPVFIHLWSRRESKVVMVGSVRFFEHSETVQSKHLRLNELLLLLLRCLFLCLLFLWLSGLRLPYDDKPAARIYLIDPALAEHRYIQDSLLSGHSARWFLPGFPETDDQPASTGPVNQWQLASEVVSLQADSIFIFTGGYLRNLGDYRPALPGHVQWFTLEPTQSAYSPQEFPVYWSEDTVRLISYDYSGKTSLVNERRVAETVLPEKSTIHIVITPDSAHTSLGFLKEVLNGVADYLRVSIDYVHHADTATDLGIWTGKDVPPPARYPWIVPGNEQGIVPLHYNNGYWKLSNQLTPDEVVRSGLPDKLLRISGLIPEKLDPADPRLTDPRLAMPGISAKKSVGGPVSRPFYPVLVLLALTLIAERYLSATKRQ